MIFARNLSMFLLGLACQVLAGVFPKLSGALLAPASLLLSAADVRSVLDGSFVKHVTILVLALACQSFAALAPVGWGVAVPLLAAGGILMSASDIKRVLKGPETPAAPIVTPPSDPVVKSLKGQMDAAAQGAVPASEMPTPAETPRRKTRP